MESYFRKVFKLDKNKIMSVEKVLETLHAIGKPMKTGEIAEASGLDKKEVDMAMKVLKKEE